MIATARFDDLDRNGYTVLPDVIEPEFLRDLNRRIDQLFEIEGESAGSEFKQEAGCRRLANLVNKGDVFFDVIASEQVLPYVEHVLGSFKLSSLNVRSVEPESGVRQPLHADMGATPDEHGFWVCNAVWMLQDITRENGPLRVIPGTHRSGRLPQQVLDNPLDRHDDEVLVTGSAGTVVVLNAHTWHGGTENQSSTPRRALHAFYCRRDKPQQQYQKQLLDQVVQDRLAVHLRGLLALDDPENDRISSVQRVTSGFLK